MCWIAQLFSKVCLSHFLCLLVDLRYCYGSGGTYQPACSSRGEYRGGSQTSNAIEEQRRRCKLQAFQWFWSSGFTSWTNYDRWGKSKPLTLLISYFVLKVHQFVNLEDFALRVLNWTFHFGALPLRSRDLSLNIVHVVISPFDFPLKNEKYMEKFLRSGCLPEFSSIRVLIAI